jgi:hypothetical protein
MPKNSTTTIACALCLGAAPEPYLAASLAGIADAVDLLAVNDNSGLARSPSAEALAGSAFAARGSLRVERHPFVDFADMRNRAFGMLRGLERPPDWVLFLDADEVHGEQVRYLAREVLPRLAPRYGQLDAYTYHFWGTFGWISDVARRLNFFRYDPDLRWTNPIHEKLEGVRGEPLVVPYVYHHYGNVATPQALAEKHGKYFALGNKVPQPPAPEVADAGLFLEAARRVRPFHGAHPAAARPTVARLEAEHAGAFAALDAGLRARRDAGARALGTLRGLNESLRVQLRRLEHPGLYAAPSEAR